MATQYDVQSRYDQQASLMAINVHLSAPELHDFSDLRSANGQSNHVFRWVIAIVALLTIGHFVFNPSDMTQEARASITTTSTASPL
jgi:hypothetical protein